MYAASGRAALDLAVGKHLASPPHVPCYKIATGMYGHLPPGTVGISMGSSSLTS